MKILLIKPPLSRNLLTMYKAEPLELEYLASAVMEHEVEILDMRIDNNLAKKLEQHKPDFVGITAHTCEVNVATDVLKEVKKFNSNITTAVGGSHATFAPFDLSFPFVDVLFLGISDFSFKEYINTREEGGDVRIVNNIALQNENDFYFTEQTDVDVNLDLIPQPARHLTRHYRKKYRDQMRRKFALVLTSRGCPFRCTFCASWKIMKGKCIARNPESIVEELANLHDDVERVHFADDNTLYDVRKAWQLSELIKERKIKKKFTMHARTDTIVKHPDLIENFREAGLECITVGIESFKNSELDLLNKKTSVPMNNEAIRILQKLGISIAAHIIVNPNYSEEDFKRLYKYVCDMDLFRPAFPILTPLPGTELYFDNSDRFVIKNYDFFDLAHSVFPTKLNRREFYRRFSKLYTKSYSFHRYFKSRFKDLRSLFIKSADNIPSHTDRLSLFRLALTSVFALPKYFRVKKIYKSEPLI